VGRHTRPTVPQGCCTSCDGYENGHNVQNHCGESLLPSISRSQTSISTTSVASSCVKEGSRLKLLLPEECCNEYEQKDASSNQPRDRCCHNTKTSKAKDLDSKIGQEQCCTDKRFPGHYNSAQANPQSEACYLGSSRPDVLSNSCCKEESAEHNGRTNCCNKTVDRNIDLEECCSDQQPCKCNGSSPHRPNGSYLACIC
jgi:hypothetical protein